MLPSAYIKVWLSYTFLYITGAWTLVKEWKVSDEIGRSILIFLPIFTVVSILAIPYYSNAGSSTDLVLPNIVRIMLLNNIIARTIMQLINTPLHRFFHPDHFPSTFSVVKETMINSCVNCFIASGETVLLFATV